MISKRTKLSLCQYLDLQDPEFLRVLFEKHGLDANCLQTNYLNPLMNMLEQLLTDANAQQLHGLLDEVARTSGDLRCRVSPRYRYDQRWDDLVRCLELDGYRIEGHNLVAADPTVAGSAPVDDDLSTELRRSGLREADDIIRIMENSATAFRKVPPDYNACLSNSRVALQTLATAIANVRKATHPGSFDETKWGQVLSYLRTSELITKSEEEGLAGVFSFVSPGAHIPVGLSEEEVARLGRSLVASMCYFLVKRFNQ